MHQIGSTCLVTKAVHILPPQKKKKKGDSPHMLLHNCIQQCYWLTQIFKWSCLLAPFSHQGKGRRGEENIADKLFIYLPMPSFEHHSKGSMSNQVFSAVLKISHSLHCDGLTVQLMDSLECCSPIQKIILGQTIHSVLVMLLLALRIYCMTDCSDLPYCINKGCSRDIMHSHAL